MQISPQLSHSFPPEMLGSGKRGGWRERIAASPIFKTLFLLSPYFNANHLTRDNMAT
jgi:hypothetical protein